MTSNPPALSTIDPPWEQLVLVCRKCTEKLGGGFGKSGQQSLRDEMKRLLKDAGLWQRIRVIETGCLAVCPKDAVSLLSLASPGHVLVIAEGADPAAVLARITGQEPPHEHVRWRETSR